MGTKYRATMSIVAACIVVIFFSCAKDKEQGGQRLASPKEAGSPLAETIPPPANQANEPEVGNEMILPAVKRGNDDLLLAYRHTHHAYQSQYGFDTEIFRFRKNANGSLREVAISKRLMDGETTFDGIDFSHVNQTVAIKSVFEGMGGSDCTLQPEGSALVAKGKDFKYSYAAPEAGVLRIERHYRGLDYAEEWRRLDGGQCLVTDSRGENAKGHFEGEWPKPRRYVERPDNDDSGGSDTEFEFFDVEKGLKFRADSVEPLGELLVMGFDALFPEGPSLEAIAILDIVLGEERRITPLLARQYLGKRP